MTDEKRARCYYSCHDNRVFDVYVKNPGRGLLTSEEILLRHEGDGYEIKLSYNEAYVLFEDLVEALDGPCAGGCR